jgi:hypothetical protein
MSPSEFKKIEDQYKEIFGVWPAMPRPISLEAFFDLVKAAVKNKVPIANAEDQYGGEQVLL